MVSFQTKNPNQGIFGGPWNGNFLYILVIWNILQPLGILYGRWNFVVIWYSFFPLRYIVPRKIWQPCPHAAGINIRDRQAKVIFTSKLLLHCHRVQRDQIGPSFAICYPLFGTLAARKLSE
jgi:hypothetical protein